MISYSMIFFLVSVFNLEFEITLNKYMVFYEEGRGIFKITAFLKYNSYDPLRDIDFFFFLKNIHRFMSPSKKLLNL